MKKILHIKRQLNSNSESYYENFVYESDNENATVATALLTTPVIWEHSCLQKKCGACAMVINGKPALACNTRLADIDCEIINIEPLHKFPVIQDLRVDRQALMDKLKELKVWLESDSINGNENISYEASRCLECGLCLEVCPNYYMDGKFGGMAAMTPLARIIDKAFKDQRKELKKNYKKGVYNSCGKSLACRDICPAKIDIDKLLVKSNAAAVWNRWNKE